MSATALPPITTLDDKFPSLLDSLGRKGKRKYALSDPTCIEDHADKAKLLLNKQTVGNVLVKKRTDGRQYFSAMIRKDALPTRKIKKGDPSPYERFIRLAYLEGKGRLDNYTIPFP